uniref:Ig-like domain-containing protein n=1 Tax=Strigamia maritima TaxID=126957 RepID=T1J7Y1_STRMM
MLDDSYEVTSLGIVRNDLLVPVLTRQDFSTVFTCKANNNNITNPKSTSVTVDMNLKPLEVKILNIEQFLSATRRYELACQSVGSRPPPIMAWWNGEKRMKRTEETISQDTNVTTSILIFTPTSQDHGKTLACRAENPAIPGSGIQHTWKLNVHYRPISELSIDSSISLENIHEGDEVVLSCTVQSNPSIISLFWRFQGKQLIPSAENGVISSNQSLNLQHIRRNQGGRYSCVGVNSEGEGESNQIALHVKHIPVCKNGQKNSYTAARHETVTIPCEVEAFPRRLTFRWAFNQSTKYVAEGRALITTDRLRSSLVYIPKSQNDFGTFYCFAMNEMGTQLKPCVFTLAPAGPPDPPNNCTILNKTSSSFVISCQTGYDGGVSPTFFCQIIDAASHKLVIEVNSSQPIFHLANLPSNSRFLISIYAYNSKGRSEAVVAAADTEHISNKQFDIEEWLPTIFGVALGTVVILALLCVILIILLNVRNRRRNCKKNYQMKQFDR